MVKFLDLQKINAQYEVELKKVAAEVIDSGWYLLGERVNQFEQDLVSYQEGKIRIVCPTLEFYSHELVNQFKVPLDLLSIAHSCHISNIACGKCSGCKKQLKVRY